MSDEKENSVDRNWTFNVKLVYESFQECAENSDALKMECYLTAYRELYRFFLALGSVFGFVASDIISKITILENFLKSDVGNNYATIQSMINYEKELDLLNKDNIVSGSRTLLRLHRALKFISALMRKLSCAQPHDKMAPIAQECYKQTLSKFHPWLIRNTAHLAMYSLSTCQNLIEKACGNEAENVAEEMGKLADAADLCYDVTQSYYEEHNLLDLP
ncbi:ceramide-1-phosphate transfer protein-like [Centruroides sculpturatus]|uniref:ceramide-1-phosphate transfer protein-like n=1 Tax=Centruroides sculpturatus TaxID=218467 RepID=UPI000C6E172F|nr:ceramide-1-phosphate transfer protein-like [Centruroides sculpturatus]